MTTWKDGSDYGKLCREITNENGTHIICAVWTKRYSLDKRDKEPWPEGKRNFHLILQAPLMLEALEAIRDQAECYLQPLRAVGVSRARWAAVRDRAMKAIAAVKGDNNSEDELV